MDRDNKAIAQHLTPENQKVLELIEQKEIKLKKMCLEVKQGKITLMQERKEFEEYKLEFLNCHK